MTLKHWIKTWESTDHSQAVVYILLVVGIVLMLVAALWR